MRETGYPKKKKKRIFQELLELLGSEFVQWRRIHLQIYKCFFFFWCGGGVKGGGGLGFTALLQEESFM